MYILFIYINEYRREVKERLVLWQFVFIFLDEIVGHELAFAFDGHQSSLLEVVAPSAKDGTRLLRHLVTFKSNQIKSNQIKSNQIKSNQIKSDDIIPTEFFEDHSTSVVADTPLWIGRSLTHFFLQLLTQTTKSRFWKFVLECSRPFRCFPFWRPRWRRCPKCRSAAWWLRWLRR